MYEKNVKWAIAIAVLFTMLFSPYAAQAQERQKASVVVIVVNNAHTDYDGEIQQKIQAWVDRKFLGVYDMVPSQPFVAKLQELNVSDFGPGQLPLCEKTFFSSNVDYAVYIEVKPFVQNNHVALFRYGKCTVASGTIRIYDIVNNRFLCDTTYAGKSAKDEQAVFLDERIIALFSVDSKSISLQAVDNLLYWIGETISVKLPLDPQPKRRQ